MDSPGDGEAESIDLKVKLASRGLEGGLFEVCMYVCIIFVRGPTAPKVPYWETGRIELGRISMI
jgi:hypothetical protein